MDRSLIPVERRHVDIYHARSLFLRALAISSAKAVEARTAHLPMTRITFPQTS